MTWSRWKTLSLPAAAFTAAAVAVVASSVDGRPAPQPMPPAGASAALSAQQWEETARAGRATPQVVLPAKAQGSPMSPVVKAQ